MAKWINLEGECHRVADIENFKVCVTPCKESGEEGIFNFYLRLMIQSKHHSIYLGDYVLTPIMEDYIDNVFPEEVAIYLESDGIMVYEETLPDIFDIKLEEVLKFHNL